MRRLLLVWAWSSVAVAADVDADIVVTSTQIPTPLTAIGGAVTVLDLKDYDTTDLSVAAVLEQETGIAISRSGGTGQVAQVRMRGAEANHVLVLLDGVEIASPAIGLDLSHVSIQGLARIEILRGAQSALWGSNAAAGAIHLISKQTAEPSATLTQRIGQDRTSESRLSLTSGTEQTQINVHGQVFVTDGDNAIANGSETDRARHREAHLAAHHRIDAHTDVRATLRMDRAFTEYDGSQFGQLTDLPNHSRNARTIGSLAWQSQVDAVHLSARAGYLESRHFAQDSFGATESIGQRVNVAATAWRTVTQCAWLDSCTLGVGVESERERYTRGHVGPHVAKSHSLTGLIQSTHQYFSVDLSLRRDFNQHFADADTYRVGISVPLPDDAWQLYAATGSGIVNPTLTERFGFFPSSFIGNAALIPERTRDYELGLRYAQGRTSARVSYFRQRLTDEIQSTYDVATQLSSVQNSTATSHRRGIEAELDIPLTPAWAAQVRYTYTKATEPGGAQAVPEVRRPRHQYNLRLRYTHDADRITVGTQAVRSVRDLDFSQFPAPRVALENYSTTDVTWRRQLTADWTAVFAVRNLFNETYGEVLGYRSADRNLSLALQVSL